MKSYGIMAETYRDLFASGKITKQEAKKKIRLYEFLAGCDGEDLLGLIDSSAFNDIIRAYLDLAVDLSEVSKAVKEKINFRSYGVMDEVCAKEALERYYKGKRGEGV